MDVKQTRLILISFRNGVSEYTITFCYLDIHVYIIMCLRVRGRINTDVINKKNRIIPRISLKKCSAQELHVPTCQLGPIVQPDLWVFDNHNCHESMHYTLCMYVCMYVCMCVYVYVCMCVCVGGGVCACVYLCMYACMYVCIVCMYVCMHV